MSVAVVTDSTACFPRGWGSAPSEPYVVPLAVTVEGEVFTEGEDIIAADVDKAQRDGKTVTTGRPAPARFEQAFADAQAAGADEIVSVHVSQKLSSTIVSAQAAAETAEVPVHVLDSKVIGMGLGFAASAGAELARTGASAKAVVERIEAVAATAQAFIYVDSLDALRRGGRLGRAGALFGTALSIKPVLGLRDGGLVPIERVRTTPKAIDRVLQRTIEAAQTIVDGPDRLRIAVHSLARRDLAELIMDNLTEKFGRDSVVDASLGSVVTAHVGAGTVATVVVAIPSDSSTD